MLTNLLLQTLQCRESYLLFVLIEEVLSYCPNGQNLKICFMILSLDLSLHYLSRVSTQQCKLHSREIQMLNSFSFSKSLRLPFAIFKWDLQWGYIQFEIGQISES